MPCYNYSSNDPIYYNPNAGQWAVEKVYTASGTTYSYGPIALMCELPAADQLCVYTRASAGAAETKLTLNLDYTVTGSPTENIVLTTGAVSGQVVIRRCTPNDKMLFQFVDGAKITAKQLNVSLHQLLFLGQEKEWVGATNNHFYPLSSSVAAWSAVTAYTVGQYALQGGVVYQCIANSTNNTPPNATYWTPVNFVTNGFIIQGGATLSGPVTFNLNNITAGKGLVWNGTQFEAGTIGGLINNLDDVVITTPVSGDILVYNGLNWVDQAPTVDITQNNLLFKDHVFTDRTYTSGTSYTNGIAAISAPIILDAFSNVNGDYVVPDVPTVYHILKKLIPGEEAPETFFNDVDTAVTQISNAITNPIKAQLYWNLSRAVPSIALTDGASGDTLPNYKNSFWDNPNELYHASMASNIELLKYHGVSASSILYKDNPYFYREAGTTYSKLFGKNIKSFYLNIPECYTTALCNIPVTTGGNFTILSDITLANLKNSNSTTRDEYLTALRDFAFAGVRSGLASGITTVKLYDNQARFAKSFLLSVDYNGWENISYKRLESSEAASSCLFKIPSQIIYYNKQALAFKYNTSAIVTTAASTWPETAFGSSAATNSAFSSSVRFTGAGDLNYTANGSSSVTSPGMGNVFKADQFWGNWTSTWIGDGGNAHFNEADIDWAVSGVTAGTTELGLNLYDVYFQQLGKTGDITTGGTDTSLNASSMYPWPYRPNYWEKTDPLFDGYIGTHHFNFDSNRLFSDASLFVPDPRDEYVFRVVIKDNVFSAFDVITSESIASALILEHGFDEHPNANIRAVFQNTKAEIYRKNNTPRQVQRTKTRLSKNDVKVFIQNEHFEYRELGNTATKQYVINLCISVPRLKSIGYAKVYREPIPSYDPDGTTNLLNATQDDDADRGSWTFYLHNDAISNIDADGIEFGVDVVNLGGTVYSPKLVAAAGRNECAVKFTRLGIPSNMWIRLSVLNTDGTTSLVSGTTMPFN